MQVGSLRSGQQCFLCILTIYFQRERPSYILKHHPMAPAKIIHVTGHLRFSMPTHPSPASNVPLCQEPLPKSVCQCLPGSSTCLASPQPLSHLQPWPTRITPPLRHAAKPSPPHSTCNSAPLSADCFRDSAQIDLIADGRCRPNRAFSPAPPIETTISSTIPSRVLTCLTTRSDRRLFAELYNLRRALSPQLLPIVFSCLPSCVRFLDSHIEFSRPASPSSLSPSIPAPPHAAARAPRAIPGTA